MDKKTGCEFWVIWLIILAGGYTVIADDPFVPPKLQIELTSGSSIGAMDRVLYTEEDSILFTIPTPPKLFNLTGIYCKYEKTVCNAINNTVALNAASIEMHAALLRMFSVDGLKSVAYNDSKFNESKLFNGNTVKELQKFVGSEWYQQVEVAMNDRALSLRQKRAIIVPILKKAGIIAAPTIRKVTQLFYKFPFQELEFVSGLIDTRHE